MQAWKEECNAEEKKKKEEEKAGSAARQMRRKEYCQGFLYAHKNDIMRRKKMPGKPYFNTMGGGEDAGILTQIRPSQKFNKYLVKREASTHKIIQEGGTEMANFALS